MNHYLKGALCATALVVILLAVHRPADAATCTQFHSYTTNDTVTAANLNGNITNLVTCGNNVDNTQIGTAGIYASQMKPTSTAQATFGGTQNYTFPATLIFSASSNGCSATLVCLFNDNAATKGLAFNVPTASTNGYEFQVAGTVFGQLTSGGVLEAAPLINSLNTLAPVGAIYTHAGAAVGATAHTVQDTFQPTINHVGGCVTTAFCILSSSTVTLTGAAVFTSATSYACAVSTGLTVSLPFITNTSGTTLTFNIWNQSGGTFTNGSTVDFEYSCTGT